MASSQVVYHHTLILPFFSAPQTEGQPTQQSQGLMVIDPSQTHDFWWFGWWHNPKEVDVLGGSFGYIVSSPEVFLVGPHLMDLRTLEVSGGSHFPEGRREEMLIVRLAGLVVVLPSHSDEFWLLNEGLSVILFKGLATDLPSFCFWQGGSSGVSSSSTFSSCLGIDTP